MKQHEDNRIYWIDAMRSFACLCVITLHAYVPGGEHGARIVGAINYFVVAGFILFFMISGSLVLNEPKKLFPFMKQRFLRIAVPMVIWTIITLLIGCFTGKMGWSDLPQAILLIPFKPQFGTYWFIYVLFGIYLVTPILSLWLNHCTRNELRVILMLGAIALAIPYLTFIDSDFSNIVSLSNGWLYYFNGYLWLAVMGYYLRRYVNIPRFKWWHYALIVLIIALPVCHFLLKMPPRLLQDNLAINIVLLSCAYFIIIKHIKLGNRMKRIVCNFAKHSFGIYLIHKQLMNFVILPLMPQSFSLHYIIMYIAVVTTVIVVCYTIVHLLSKLPYSKYFIGL